MFDGLFRRARPDTKQLTDPEPNSLKGILEKFYFDGEPTESEMSIVRTELAGGGIYGIYRSLNEIKESWNHSLKERILADEKNRLIVIDAIAKELGTKQAALALAGTVGESFGINIWTEPALRDGIKKQIINTFEEGRYDDAMTYCGRAGFNKEELLGPHAEESYIGSLRRGKYYLSKTIAEEFNLGTDSLQSNPTVVAAAREGFLGMLRGSERYIDVEGYRKFSTPSRVFDTEVQDAVYDRANAILAEVEKKHTVGESMQTVYDAATADSISELKIFLDEARANKEALKDERVPNKFNNLKFGDQSVPTENAGERIENRAFRIICRSLEEGFISQKILRLKDDMQIPRLLFQSTAFTRAFKDAIELVAIEEWFDYGALATLIADFDSKGVLISQPDIRPKIIALVEKACSGFVADNKGSISEVERLIEAARLNPQEKQSQAVQNFGKSIFETDLLGGDAKTLEHIDKYGLDPATLVGFVKEACYQELKRAMKDSRNADIDFLNALIAKFGIDQKALASEVVIDELKNDKVVLTSISSFIERFPIDKTFSDKDLVVARLCLMGEILKASQKNEYSNESEHKNPTPELWFTSTINNFSEQEVIQSVREAIGNLIVQAEEGVTGQIEAMLKHYKIGTEFFSSRGYAAALVDSLKRSKRDPMPNILGVILKYGIPGAHPEIKELAREAAAWQITLLIKDAGIYYIENSSTNEAISFLKKSFDLSDEQVRVAGRMGLARRFSTTITVIDPAMIDRDLMKLSDSFDLQVERLTQDEHMRFEKLLAISEIWTVKLINPTLLKSAESNEQVLEKCLSMFREAKVSAWSNEMNVNQFEKAAKVFGYEHMFSYVRRVPTSNQLHTAFHQFGAISKLYDRSGLSASAFYGQILDQVAADGTRYDEGPSYSHLNAIALSTNVDIAGTLGIARKYAPSIPNVGALAETFDNPAKVFASWNNLKRFTELQALLAKKEILDQLVELRGQAGKEKLAQYVETLAFHPNSKVDMQAVLQFWRDPEQFLGAAASHTPTEVHNRKKPSNYIEIPHLDLTAEELRDALVNGNLDSLQAFTPLEIRYRVETERVDLQAEILRALGSRSQKLAGSARNIKALTAALNNLLKPHGATVFAVAKGEVDVPEEARGDIAAALYDPEMGIKREHGDGLEVIARIHRKSSPIGALAGNDTASCMPFGDGKNTHYQFNPNTALFTVQVRTDKGLRTIAQSVLTKDRDVGVAVPTLVAAMNDRKHLDQVMSEKVLKEADSLLSADNVEVNPNYKEGVMKSVIERVYRDFFRAYQERNAKAQGLDKKRLVIGMGYSDALSSLPKIPNTFVPLAPVSYSDKTHAEAYELDLTKMSEGVEQVSVKEEPLERAPKFEFTVKGVSSLTFEDTLGAAYLEGKAFKENEALIVNLHNIENALIATQINAVAKGRANLSLRYVDAKGSMRGYLIAYEGLAEGDANSDRKTQERIVYATDLAADPENVRAGGSLIKGFVEVYKKAYLDRGEALPIVAEMRETTSYPIIKRQFEKLAKDLGASFTMEETGTYQAGNDTTHRVIIRKKA